MANPSRGGDAKPRASLRRPGCRTGFAWKFCDLRRSAGGFLLWELTVRFGVRSRFGADVLFCNLPEVIFFGLYLL